MVCNRQVVVLVADDVYLQAPGVNVINLRDSNAGFESVSIFFDTFSFLIWQHYSNFFVSVSLPLRASLID